MPTSRGPNRPGPGRSGGAGRSTARGTARGSVRGAARGSGRGTVRTRDGATGTRRPGATRRPAATPAQQPEAVEPAITREETYLGPGARRRASLTTRAIALAVVLLVLTISYASSLRVYFKQRQDIADTQQQIINAQRNIQQLGDEISRWNDPNYVRAQARDRLGWVMPGERGYRVVGPDGKPVTGDTEIAASDAPQPPKQAWYAKLWGSVETADHPQPVKKADPADRPPITEKTKHR